MTSACLQRNVSFPPHGTSHIIAGTTSLLQRIAMMWQQQNSLRRTQRLLEARHWRTVRHYSVESQICPWARHPEPSAGNTACPPSSIRAVCDRMLTWYICFRKQIETRLSNPSKSDSSPFFLSTLAAGGWVITSCCVAHYITTPHLTAVPGIMGTKRSYFDRVLDPSTLPIALVHYDGLVSPSLAIKNG
jgi:hypothetical protein